MSQPLFELKNKVNTVTSAQYYLEYFNKVYVKHFLSKRFNHKSMWLEQPPLTAS